MPKLGPYSRETVLATLDRRTREARMAGSLRQEMLAQVDGEPTAQQILLLDCICMTSVRLAMMDRRLIRDGGLTPRDDRHASGWTSALTKLLAAWRTTLDPKRKPKASSGPTLEDFIAGRGTGAPL